LKKEKEKVVSGKIQSSNSGSKPGGDLSSAVRQRRNVAKSLKMSPYGIRFFWGI